MSSPRIFGIFGDHPRHLHYANAIERSYGLCGAIIQTRGGIVPPTPANIPLRDAQNWERHFANRAYWERELFGDATMPDCKIAFSSSANLSGPTNAAYLRSTRPDIVLVFGCGMIREPLLSAVSAPVVNMHLGISPRYRGAATLFWPFYFLEPNWAGVTFHQITPEPDAGDILHQCAPALERGHTIHQVAAYAVIQAATDMLELLERYPHWSWRSQRNTGKCFLAGDFQPQHLRMIYNVWQDKLVDAYLDGTIQPRRPLLFADNLEAQYAAV